MLLSEEAEHTGPGFATFGQVVLVQPCGIAVKADDPDVLFVANGDAAAGETGTVQRSKNRGHTWETLRLPVVPNTPMWTFAMHAADPNLVLTCSHYGQVFVSEDAGDSWSKVRREFSEIRALAWVPN